VDVHPLRRRAREMKTPAKTLAVWLIIGVLVITAAFATYHISRAMSPAVKAFLDSAAIDPNAITAYFTALAFLGFVITSVFQARAIAAAEKRNQRFQQDSEWLTVQIARLHTFGELNDRTNLEKALRELEEHWRQMSTWMRDESKS
jgi:H+/Cl- antiporter ClcA